MSKKCIVCNEQVDWAQVLEELGAILDQADRYGVESLTEHEQVVFLGLVCSRGCYNNLQ